MPIEMLEPLGSFVVANIAWITVFVYAAAITLKLNGYDQRVAFGFSYMDFLAITVSGVFSYVVVSPTTGLENILSQITWWVFGYAVAKPFIVDKFIS